MKTTRIDDRTADQKKTHYVLVEAFTADMLTEKVNKYTEEYNYEVVGNPIITYISSEDYTLYNQAVKKRIPNNNPMCG